jgi:transposase
MGRPDKASTINQADRLQLQSMVHSRSMPYSLVRRARIVLLSGEGESNREVARRCGVSAPAVSHWRRRYQERGLGGLHDELRPGRPRTHDDEKVAELIKLVVENKPPLCSPRSTCSMAK